MDHFSPILELKITKILETTSCWYNTVGQQTFLHFLTGSEIPTDLEITWKLQALEVSNGFNTHNLPGNLERSLDLSRWLLSKVHLRSLSVGIFCKENRKTWQHFWRTFFFKRWDDSVAEQRTHWNIAICKSLAIQVKNPPNGNTSKNCLHLSKITTYIFHLVNKKPVCKGDNILSSTRGPASLPGRLNSNACNLFASCNFPIFFRFQRGKPPWREFFSHSCYVVLVGKLQNDILIFNNSVGRPTSSIGRNGRFPDFTTVVVKGVRGLLQIREKEGPNFKQKMTQETFSTKPTMLSTPTPSQWRLSPHKLESLRIQLPPSTLPWRSTQIFEDLLSKNYLVYSPFWGSTSPAESPWFLAFFQRGLSIKTK